MFYSIRLDRASALAGDLVADAIFTAKETDLANRPFNVLFICSGNSARLLFAQALLKENGHGRVHAYSAGT